MLNRYWLNSALWRFIPLDILLSVASLEQYEKNKRGITIPLNLSEQQFYSMLNLLGPCLEDHPRYHIQLRNEDNQYTYICFEIIGE